jgi:membrane protein
MRRSKEDRLTSTVSTPRVSTSTHDWREVLAQVRHEYREDNLTLLSAGIAFFAVLSSAPALAAVVAVYGLFASPEDVTRHVDDLASGMPEDARRLLTDQLTQVVSTSRSGLGLSVLIGIALAFWGASVATKHLIVALGQIFDQNEPQGVISLRLRALGLTVAGLLFMGIVLLLLTFAPTWADSALGDSGRWLISTLRWPLIGSLMLFGLTALYRYAPQREHGTLRWATWGSASATGLWLVASSLFSIYIAHFGSYDETYGSLAAVVVMMLWLYLTALCVLLGAELDAALERRRRVDPH